VGSPALELMALIARKAPRRPRLQADSLRHDSAGASTRRQALERWCVSGRHRRGRGSRSALVIRQRDHWRPGIRLLLRARKAGGYLAAKAV